MDEQLEQHASKPFQWSNPFLVLYHDVLLRQFLCKQGSSMFEWMFWLNLVQDQGKSSLIIKQSVSKTDWNQGFIDYDWLSRTKYQNLFKSILKKQVQHPTSSYKT